MPYSTSWEPRGVLWTFRGVVSGEELFRSNQEIYGDERFDEMAYQIVDFSAVDRFDVSHDDMTAMAGNDKAAALSNPSVRVAVVATDELIKRLSTAYESQCAESPWEHKIFDTLSEARAWATQKHGSLRPTNPPR